MRTDLRAALAAIALFLPAAVAAQPTALPTCGQQAVDRLRSLGVDPATLASAQTVGVPGSASSGVTQYQTWFTSNACRGGYLVLLRTDCVPIGVEGGRGQCTIPGRR